MGRSVVSVQSERSSRRRVTSCVCSACPALCATIAGLQRASHQGQIANQIEGLVAAEFVRESAAGRSRRSRVVQHDGVGERAAADQAHRLQAAAKSFTKPNVRARSQLAAEGFAVDGHLDFLRADRGMVVVDKAVHAEFVGGIDADAAVAVGKFKRLDHTDIAPLAAQAAHAGLRQKSINGFDEPSRIGSSSASIST